MRKNNRKIRRLAGLFSWGIKTGLLLNLLVLSNQYASAQEVFSIYYPSGDYKLLEDNKQEINKYIFSHNLKKIDSLQVIGYADSTGKKRLNMRLSHKRADKVKEYLVKILPAKTPVSSFARGEENALRNPNDNHRRVEIHLFYAGKLVEDSTELYEYFGNTKTCFVLSDSVMKNCNIIRFNDGRSNMVILEMEPHLFSRNQVYYTLTKGSQYAKIIKWKLEMSGEGWWRHERYRARIKEADFESYGVLTKKKVHADYNECIVCDKDMNAPLKLKSELLPEVYIMQHLQLRKKMLEGEYLLIVPQDYVSPSRSYYFDKNYDRPIEWHTKFGIRNRPYYFASVPAEYLKNKDWNVYSNRSTCIPSGDSLKINYPLDTLGPHQCLPESRGGLNALEYGLEATYWNYDFRAAAISGYAQYTGTRFEYSLNLGVDLKARFQAMLETDYLIFSFDPYKQTFIGNANRSLIHDFHPTLAAYAGTNLTFISDRPNAGLIHALYIGAAYNNNPFSLSFDRFYTNLGVCTNYLNSGGLNFSLYLQVGVKFKM
ncbi:OmpA family protein [Fluviicola sp.]|uniref:OmpA family protein n=1 Tax=Fluviicola sp. TaxID=1917219 RepID=UPI0031CF0AFD